MVPVDTMVTNQVAITSPTDGNPNNNTASTSTTVSEGTDLAVTKTVNNATPRVGDLVTFTLAVDNFGPSNATGARLTERLPAGLELVEARPTQGAYNSTTGVWTIGNLSARLRATLALDARVRQPGVLSMASQERGRRTGLACFCPL
jgi:uncharacterized repeat protein (TIGR01451 family)